MNPRIPDIQASIAEPKVCPGNDPVIVDLQRGKTGPDPYFRVPVFLSPSRRACV